MLKLQDIMSRDVVTVSPDLTVRDAMALLAGRHVSGAPVVSGTTVVGVISTTDLLDFASSLPGVPTVRSEENSAWGEWEDDDDAKVEARELPAGAYFTELWSDVGADVEERFAESSGPEWNVLEEHTVSEAMTHEVCSLPPTADVRTAADYMRRQGIHRVLVVDAGRLCGIVSTMDVTAAVADDKLVRRTYVFNRDAEFDGRE